MSGKLFLGCSGPTFGDFLMRFMSDRRRSPVTERRIKGPGEQTGGRLNDSP
jgi:hypothetical protein